MNIYKTVKHWHHIIPKHSGGTDDPENLIHLTIEEHANAHKELYELYGDELDKIAWLGLSGQIGKEEILLRIYQENGKRAGASNIGKTPWNKGKTGIYTEATLEKMKKSKTDEHKQKMKKPKSNTTNMGIYERTPEQREQLRLRKLGKIEDRTTCTICNEQISVVYIKKHEKLCIEAKHDCVLCGTPITGLAKKNNKTCSYHCSVTKQHADRKR